MEDGNNPGVDILARVNSITSKLQNAMPDFIKLSNGNNMQAAKRARKVILDIEKNDIKQLKLDIRAARVARPYKKTKE